MAGVLERIIGPRRRLMTPFTSLESVHPKVLELQTAKAILAETFGIRLSEVDDMIRQRCESKEQWPENFWLDAE